MSEKKIPIKCKGNRYLDVEEFKDFQGNLKKFTKEGLVKLKKSILDLGWVAPVFVWNQNLILDGHGRLKALKELLKEGYTIDKIPVVDIEGKTKKEAAKILLAVNSQYQRMTQEGFQAFLFDMDLKLEDLDSINLPDINLEILEEKAEEKENLSPFENLSPLELDEESKREIDKAERIFIQYSGGRDSTYALLKVLPWLDLNKTEAVFVDTGVEFPDLVVFAMRLCESVGVKLTILKSPKSWHEIFGVQKSFPDVRFRSCIDLLINEPFDKYVESFGVKTLTIRGGRQSQKLSKNSGRGKTGLVQTVKNGKIRILNPIYYVDEKTFEEEIKKIPIWQGYSKGFQRTACWTCPFQKVEQWEALKREYPLLWESLREMALTFEFRYYKGDNIVPRFIKYWRGQENG